MANYILTNLRSSLYSRPTGVKLGELLGFIPVNSFRGVEDPNILIRYGLTSYPNEDLKFKRVYNKADDLKNIVNKLVFSRYLLTHNYTLTPRIWTSKREITEEDLPVLGRKRYHSRGADIKIIETISDLRRDLSDYYVQFIRSICEYRVHIFKNRPIRIQKKVATGEESFIRNVDHDYVLADHYTHNVELEKAIISEAIKIMTLLNLDFGALDFIVSEDNTPYVLEVNSAPRLNKYGRQLYSYYILNDIGEEVSPDQFSRLRYNEGRFFNGLEEIEFRDIVKKNEENVYS